jgi:hypothetical protein
MASRIEAAWAAVLDRSWIVVLLAVAICAGWWSGAVLLGRPVDAGRGGALAVALAFLTLFMHRSQGDRIFTILADEGPRLLASLDPDGEDKEKSAAAQLEKVERGLADLFGAIKATRRYESRQASRINVHLSAASVVGTLVWGFGDVVAYWL